MEHFLESSWADFVRGVGKDSENQAIAAHLTSGCSDCQASLAVWTQLQSAAESENRFQPAEELVRMVKLEFEARKQVEPQDCIDASLVFDSRMQPLAVGIRSGAITARQVVYEVDGLLVDVRLEAQPRCNKIFAVGQMLDKQVPRASVQDASVTLWTEKGLPIQTTRTSASGEFQLEFEAQDHVRLSIQIMGRPPVRIPLGTLR